MSKKQINDTVNKLLIILKPFSEWETKELIKETLLTKIINLKEK